MGNLSGCPIKWVSDEQAGSNPAYPDQANGDIKLEKDIETELGVFSNWKKVESGVYQNIGEGSFSKGDGKVISRVGRPFLVSIASLGTEQNYSENLDTKANGIEGADIFTNWVRDGLTGGYKAVIPYKDDGNEWGGHRKGFIKGSASSTSGSNDLFIIPRVKTYLYTGSMSGNLAAGTLGFEEVSDSAEVDIRSGNITLRSETSDYVYLVVIY